MVSSPKIEPTISPTMIIGIAIGMRILVKIWKVMAPKERASAILARSTRRKPVAELIITIGPLASATAMMRGSLPKPKLGDEQRHQRQHRRRDEQQDVGRHHLLDEGELRDDGGQDEADRGADREADAAAPKA